MAWVLETTTSFELYMTSGCLPEQCHTRVWLRLSQGACARTTRSVLLEFLPTPADVLILDLLYIP